MSLQIKTTGNDLSVATSPKTFEDIVDVLGKYAANDTKTLIEKEGDAWNPEYYGVTAGKNGRIDKTALAEAIFKKFNTNTKDFFGRGSVCGVSSGYGGNCTYQALDADELKQAYVEVGGKKQYLFPQQ